ncbi:MAG: UDP-N-acetylmuramate dehydrogenase [Muribaculaceae bacterium]|nr:UDP-N-acetylmuramate dehydrogenase [Muribaculaceae bacterium]
MKIERWAELAPLTTFGIPARTAALVTWADAEDLRHVMADESLPRPLKAVGGGSNLLFTGDFEGTVLLREVRPDERFVPGLPVSGGMVLDDFCRQAADAGIRGPENLSGIPGTIGGALVQNAGAYGAEIGEFLAVARVFDLTSGEVMTVNREWMQFSYRHSRLKAEEGRYIIIDALFEFPEDAAPRLDYGNLSRELQGVEPTPLAVRQAVLRVRNSKLPQPAEVGSAGSFFRNPEVAPELLEPDMPRFLLPSGLAKVPAAWLIDRCGFKGVRRGGAMVWPLQPLVICNPEFKATASDVVTLENEIISAVKERFNITLLAEVEHV